MELYRQRLTRSESHLPLIWRQTSRVRIIVSVTASIALTSSEKSDIIMTAENAVIAVILQSFLFTKN